MKQYAAVDDTLYLWFGANDTSGSGGDGATALADVRLAGAAADAIPVYSPTPTLLSHANYPDGAYEISIVASAANGFATGNTYAVFCTIAIDSQNPTGFVGSFDLKPVESNIKQCGGNAVAAGAIPNAAADAAGGLPVSDAGGLDLDTKLANTNEITAARMAALTDWINGGRLDLILDIIAADTTTDIPALIATAQNDLDTITGADGVTLATLQALYAPNKVVPDVAGTAATPADVVAALMNIHLDHLFAVDYDPASKPGTATALLNELVEDDGGIARYTANALEQAPIAGENPNVLVDTTVASFIDQTHLVLSAGSDEDGAYKDQAVVVYDASNSNFPSVRMCSAYEGATKIVTLDFAPDFTIMDGDGCKVFVTAKGSIAPTVEQIRTEMEGVGYKLALIEADTNDLQTNQGDWATATGFSSHTAADVLSSIVEGTLELKQAIQAIMAFTANKATGGGTTTITFRNHADAKDRVVMTVDSNGNRTDVFYDFD